MRISRHSPHSELQSCTTSISNFWMWHTKRSKKGTTSPRFFSNLHQRWTKRAYDPDDPLGTSTRISLARTGEYATARAEIWVAVVATSSASFQLELSPAFANSLACRWSIIRVRIHAFYASLKVTATTRTACG